MPALQLAGIRQTCGGLLYVIYFLLKGATLPKGKEWWTIITLSLLNFALTNGLTTWGVQFISAGLGAIIAATFPLWMVIIKLFGKKKSRIPAQAFVGLLLGFGGVCIIFYDHLADFFNPDFRFGIMLSLSGAWSWAFGTLYTKQQASVSAFNPYFGLGLQMLFSGFLLLGIAHGSGYVIPYTEIVWQSWVSIGYLVIIGSVVSFMAFLYALQRLPTEQSSIYAYMNPIVAVLLGSIWFDEKLSIAIAVGGAVTLLGVHLINKTFRKV